MTSNSLDDCRKFNSLRSVSSVCIAALIFLASTGVTNAGDWRVLFDGTTLDGWKASGGNEQFQLVDGVIRGASSSKTHFLYTEQEYRDFELELEVKLHDT